MKNKDKIIALEKLLDYHESPELLTQTDINTIIDMLIVDQDKDIAEIINALPVQTQEYIYNNIQTSLKRHEILDKIRLFQLLKQENEIKNKKTEEKLKTNVFVFLIKKIYRNNKIKKKSRLRKKKINYCV